MKEIPYESESYYIFDRTYNHFRLLYKIHLTGAFFVVRAKKNLQYKITKWKRRLPKNVLSDVTIELTGFYPKCTHEVFQILSISLTDKIYLRDLFMRTKFHNDKERFRLNEPNLFNFL